MKIQLLIFVSLMRPDKFSILFSHVTGDRFLLTYFDLKHGCNKCITKTFLYWYFLKCFYMVANLGLFIYIDQKLNNWLMVHANREDLTPCPARHCLQLCCVVLGNDGRVFLSCSVCSLLLQPVNRESCYVQNIL